MGRGRGEKEKIRKEKGRQEKENGVDGWRRCGRGRGKRRGGRKEIGRKWEGRRKNGNEKASYTIYTQGRKRFTSNRPSLISRLYATKTNLGFVFS